MAVGGWEVCVLSACVVYLPNERLNSSQKVFLYAQSFTGLHPFSLHFSL